MQALYGYGKLSLLWLILLADQQLGRLLKKERGRLRDETHFVARLVLLVVPVLPKSWGPLVQGIRELAVVWPRGRVVARGNRAAP